MGPVTCMESPRYVQYIRLGFSSDLDENQPLPAPTGHKVKALTGFMRLFTIQIRIVGLL